MNILDEILERKRRDLIRVKKELPVETFMHKLEKSERDFKKSIDREKISLIAEVKRCSPSRGMIREFSVREVAKIYSEYAQAVSVITEEAFFRGKKEDIAEVRKHCSLPILRKDFITDEYQTYESRLLGADAILLIASILNRKKIENFIGIAKSLGMDCLVEVHTGKELEMALKAGAEIIGINSRNLKNLDVNLNTTLELSRKIPEDKIVVSESGIRSKKDVERLKGKVSAVLVGTSIMESKNMERKLRELRGYEEG